MWFPTTYGVSRRWGLEGWSSRSLGLSKLYELEIASDLWLLLGPYLFSAEPSQRTEIKTKTKNRIRKYPVPPTSQLLLLPVSWIVGRLPRSAPRHIFIRVEEGKGSDADLGSDLGSALCFRECSILTSVPWQPLLIPRQTSPNSSTPPRHFRRTAWAGDRAVPRQQ